MFVSKLRMILEDQERELRDLRSKRRQLAETKTELDAQEIEVLIGIRKTEEELSKFGEER